MIMTIMSIVIMNDIMIIMRIITRQERFAEMFGSENTSKLIPSATQVTMTMIVMMANLIIDHHHHHICIITITTTIIIVAGPHAKNKSRGVSARWQGRSQLHLNILQSWI